MSRDGTFDGSIELKVFSGQRIWVEPDNSPGWIFTTIGLLRLSSTASTVYHGCPSSDPARQFRTTKKPDEGKDWRPQGGLNTRVSSKDLTLP